MYKSGGLGLREYRYGKRVTGGCTYLGSRRITGGRYEPSAQSTIYSEGLAGLRDTLNPTR